MPHNRMGRPGVLRRTTAALGPLFSSLHRAAKTHGMDRSNAYLTALTLGRSERTRDKDKDEI